MIDLGDTIDAEAVSLGIERKSGGAYSTTGVTAGEWVGETKAEGTFLGTIQPVSGRVLRDLSEGERKEARYALWTREALVLDDIVIYGSERLRIMFVWSRPEGGFTKAVLGLLR